MIQSVFINVSNENNPPSVLHKCFQFPLSNEASVADYVLNNNEDLGKSKAGLLRNAGEKLQSRVTSYCLKPDFSNPENCLLILRNQIPYVLLYAKNAFYGTFRSRPDNFKS